MSDQILNRLQKEIINGEKVDAQKYCRLMLGKVSRTYALTIKALGQPFREPVLVGYLLCRIADTYEDTTTLDYTTKYKALELYKELFEAGSDASALMKEIRALVAPFKVDDYEEFLALYLEPVFERYFSFSKEVQEIMKRTVIEMVEGMQKTITKQHEQGTVGTDTEEELDEYCHYVAGTVGHLLTDLFRHYSPWIGDKLYAKLSDMNDAFGRALQLTNIIKDAMGDLKRGVSFIPKDLAKEYGVDLNKLYLPEYREQARKVMNHLILKATKELNLALKYTILIPKQEPRMRLFCVMPILFAIKTLALAVQSEELLNPDGNVKITRDTVKKTLRYITLYCMWDYKLVREFEKSLKEIEVALGQDIGMPFKMNPVLQVATIID